MKFLSGIVCLCIFFVTLSTLPAQELFLQKQLGDQNTQVQNDQQVSFTGEIKVKTGTRDGVLQVHAKITPHHHIYSITQPKGGPMRSKLKVADSKAFKVTGDFVANKKPNSKKLEGFDVLAEEHEGTVTWTAPIKMTEDVDVKTAVAAVTYSGQVCESGPSGSCRPLFGIKVDAKFSGFEKELAIAANENKTAESAVEPFAPGSTHGKLTGKVFHAENKPIQPGDKVTLQLTVTPEGDYHVYAYEPGKCDYMATRIGFTESNDWKISGPKASTKAHLDKSLGIDLKYHHGAVSWTFEVEIPKDAESKMYPIHGVIGLQTCNDEQCDPPSGATFVVNVPVGSGVSAPIKFEQKTYGTAKKAQAANMEAKK